MSEADEKKVLVVQQIPLEKRSRKGLIATINTLFSSEEKPIRIVYTKDQPLVVEKYMRRELVGNDTLALQPYDVIRQYASYHTVEEDTMYKTLAQAAKYIFDREARVMCVIAHSPASVKKRFINQGFVTPSEFFITATHYDDRCPPDTVIVCGSTTGLSMQELNIAVVCRWTQPK